MEPKPVYYAQNSTEATMVQHCLEDAGIESRILGGELQGGAFDIVETDPVVVVAAEDFQRAEEAIAEFREELQNSDKLSEMSDAEGQFNWPICPQCDELREATCLKCNTTSNEFSADVGNADLDVYCLACSQQVQVTFADRCRYCMHDFAAEESAEHAQAATAHQVPLNSSRALVVIGALGLVALLIAIWFIMSESS